jgi:hypothetical protein
VKDDHRLGQAPGFSPACSFLAPLQGSAQYSFHGDDNSREVNYGYNTNNNFRACDLEADNNGAYGRYKLANGQYGSVSDPNGSASGCGWVTSYASLFIGHQTCEDRGYPSCGTWVEANTP